MKPFVVVGAAVLGLASVTSAFLPPTTPKFTTHRPMSATSDTTSGSSKRSTKPLTWQESLELLISPLTPLPQRQVLFQVRGMMTTTTTTTGTPTISTTTRVKPPDMWLVAPPFLEVMFYDWWMADLHDRILYRVHLRFVRMWRWLSRRAMWMVSLQTVSRPW